MCNVCDVHARCVTSFKTGNGGSRFLSLSPPMLHKLCVRRESSHPQLCSGPFWDFCVVGPHQLGYIVSRKALAGQTPDREQRSSVAQGPH